MTHRLRVDRRLIIDHTTLSAVPCRLLLTVLSINTVIAEGMQRL